MLLVTREKQTILLASFSVCNDSLLLNSVNLVQVLSQKAPAAADLAGRIIW